MNALNPEPLPEPAASLPEVSSIHSAAYSARLRKRTQLLQKAKNSKPLQDLLLAMCRRDIKFWFNHFCWTFDPRAAHPHQPFVLYPYQEEALRDIMDAIENGKDLLIEKSRDMGASWLILLAFQYCWLFREGANFHLGSRKQDLVDNKGDISTLMEKLRYNLDWLPDWMKPAGYKGGKGGGQHDNLLRMLNPANGNVITGESSNENFARGGRYKAVLFDEFPFWPMADAAYASAGQSAPCRLTVGTPYGKHNRFAALRFSGQVKLLSLHWRLHPHKDEQWYGEQKTRMSEDELARELDINYHLSLKDRVFRNFTPENIGDLTYLSGTRIVRSWDFGYHCPACLFIQVDGYGRIRVLREVVGHEELLVDFAGKVQRICETDYPRADFEDICDPAGSQRSDKSTRTCIEILNTLKIYPFFDRTAIRDGIELIRMKLSERSPRPDPNLAEADRETPLPGLLVDRRCEQLIAAFEGGYRYSQADQELPIQEHPYEDVMDCLRYAMMSKATLSHAPPRKTQPYRPKNRYTGY
jgi:hypothetical protein